jgi:O-methyltransferase
MSRDRVSGASLSPLFKFLRKPWYWIWRLVERVWFQHRSYTLQVPFGHRVYTPWFDTNSNSEFAEILTSIRASGSFTVSPDRAYVIYQWSRRTLNLMGDIAECGVYTGGTAELLARCLQKADSPPRLHLFDTFSGMMDTRPERDYHVAGDFSDTSLNYVKRRLKDYDFCDFHQGWIPETFDEVADIAAYSFVHVDVDIYEAAIECCRWFWPRLSPGGVMVFDDYGFYPYRFALRAAVDDFFQDEEAAEPIILPTGQALVLK